MAVLDRSQCPAVESVPGRLSGAWVFRSTRMPVSAVFENLEAGAAIDEIVEQFDITREQINAVLEFAAPSLDAPTPAATVFQERTGLGETRKVLPSQPLRFPGSDVHPERERRCKRA